MGVREITVQAVSEQSSTKQEQLGARASTDDGREWVYVGNGAVALAPGKVVASKDPVTNHTNIAVAAAAAVGDTRVSITLGATAAAEGLYEDGFLTVNDAAGEGRSYRISGHGAFASAGTGWVDLVEPISVALTTSSEVTLSSEFAGVIVAPADGANLAVGVPNITIDAGNYGWAQTKGTCAVLAAGIVPQGEAAIVKTSDGQVAVASAATDVAVGIASQATVATEYRPIYLTIT